MKYFPQNVGNTLTAKHLGDEGGYVCCDPVR